MPSRRLCATVHGHVQRVGYRYFACDAAEDLGIVGYVRNASSGNVEICAEGKQEQLRTFLDLLWQGPIHANVTRIDVSWEEPTESYRGFTIEL